MTIYAVITWTRLMYAANFTFREDKSNLDCSIGMLVVVLYTRVQ